MKRKKRMRCRMIDYESLKVHLQLLARGELQYIKIVTPSELASVQLISGFIKDQHLQDQVIMRKMDGREWRIYSTHAVGLKATPYDYYIIPTIFETQKAFNEVILNETTELSVKARKTLGAIMLTGIRDSRFLSIKEFTNLKVLCSIVTATTNVPKGVVDGVSKDPTTAIQQLSTMCIPVKDKVKIFCERTGCSKTKYYAILKEVEC